MSEPAPRPADDAARQDERHDPSSAAALLDLLDLEEIDVDLFRGRQPETSLQRTFGGQVAGQALVAAVRTVDPGRHVHSLHGYFVRPGDPSVPIVYETERIRDGRSFATRRVVARQHGRTIFFMSASFQHPEPGFDHQEPMPEVAAPESLPTLQERIEQEPGRWGRFWREVRGIDLRLAGAGSNGQALTGDPEHPARARVWLRVPGTPERPLPDEPLLHVCLLAYVSDLTLLSASLVPHDVPMDGTAVQMASLDHAMWFHRPFRIDEWLLYDQVSPSASGARGLATGRIFTRDGRLIASVVQEGLIRPLR